MNYGPGPVRFPPFAEGDDKYRQTGRAKAPGATRKEKEMKRYMTENLQVKNCLICLRPARFYIGHVMLGPLWITAGFCEKHQSPPLTSLGNEQGCFGGWLPEYDIETEDCHANNLP